MSVRLDGLSSGTQPHCNLHTTLRRKWAILYIKLHPLYCPWEWENFRHEDQYNRDERHEILLGKWECHCAINFSPPKWFHASVDAASAAMTTTGNNETWETRTALTFINNVWCRYEQHVTVGFSGCFFLSFVFAVESKKALSLKCSGFKILFQNFQDNLKNFTIQKEAVWSGGSQPVGVTGTHK